MQRVLRAARMKALRMVEPTGPDGLLLLDVEEPKLGDGQVRVKVAASALNRADLLQTMGLYPAPPWAPADIPGLEYAGTVIAIGRGVTAAAVGDRVMGLVGGGAWAQEVVVDARELLPVPERLSLVEAAALPEAFITAFDAMFLQAGLQAGHSVLIHAAGSGVGTAAVQLARAFGVRSLGTARTVAKLEQLHALGLDAAIAVSGTPPQFAQAVLQANGGRGVEAVLELVGGDYLPQSLESCAPKGTVMLVGLVAGATAELPLRMILGKRLRIIGTTLRARPSEERVALCAVLRERLVPLFASGALRPVVSSTVPFAQAPDALRLLAANASFGKTVLTW
jgi:putative PIG3 family NAD(P)H quinone oxidoreductase